MRPKRTRPGGEIHGQKKRLRRGLRGRPQGHGERETGSRRGSGDGAFTAAVFIKYAAIVIVVLVIAYVVLRIVGAIQGAV
jgi:hypothetical protein